MRKLREQGAIKFLRPDAKSQVTVEYNGDGTPNQFHTVVLSTAARLASRPRWTRRGCSSNEARKEIIDKLIVPTLKSRTARSLEGRFRLRCCRARRREASRTWRIRLPHQSDGQLRNGRTARRLRLDGPQGSSSTPTASCRSARWRAPSAARTQPRSDRSAAYMARYIAKNIDVAAAGLAGECEACSFPLRHRLSRSAQHLGQHLNGIAMTKGVTDDILVELIRKHFQLTPKGSSNR